MDPSDCPTREKISAHMLGTLSEHQSSEIAQHLGQCPRCETIADEVEGVEDALIGLLRAPADEAYLDEAECRSASLAARAIEPKWKGFGGEEVPGPAEETLLRHRLGQFKLLERIGRGGMGTVYKARHRTLGRIVAVKVLAADRTGDPHAVARFLREIQAIGKLDHPNIVRPIDAGQDEGVHYLAMDFVEGHDLGTLVKTLGPVPVADACELIRQAAMALQYVHEHGMVHRDVKPSNLMLDSRGEVKLLDLGLSLLQEKEAEPESLTVSGSLMGTYDYMSPEQCGDSHQVEIRSDLYSLGCTFYELLCGRAPFSGPEHSTRGKKIGAHLHERPPAIRDLRPEVPGALAEVIDRLLAKDPADRYSAPEQLAAALEPFAADSDLPGLSGRIESHRQAEIDTVGARADTDEALSSEFLSSHAVDTRPRDISGPAQAAPEYRHVRWKPIAIGAALAGIALLGVILTISTGKGIVVIAGPDGGQLPDDVKVIVRQGGREIDVLQKDNHWRVRVTGGQYELDLRGGDDRFYLEDDHLTVRRFGRAVVTISGARDEKAGHSAATIGSESPIDPPFTAAVSRLAPDEQIEAVRKRLVELNPGFDGTLEPTIKDGRVVALRLSSELLTDLSPLAALTHLVELDCSGGGSELVSRLSNLAPLAGLPLRKLDCADTAVVDFAPLVLMPLEELQADLVLYNKDGEEALRSIETLRTVNGQPVAEYWKSRAAHQKEIDDFRDRAEAAHVGLGPERGRELQMQFVTRKLKELNPSFDDNVEPYIQDGRLTGLRIVTDHVTDVSPVRALPHLTSLNCTGRSHHPHPRGTGRLADLSPLRGLSLTDLDCSLTRAAHLSPLAGMELTRLMCRWTSVSDLTPLRGMPLNCLWCGCTEVADISPLKGMPLEDLNCSFTQIADLTPLRGMALTSLTCDHTQISDLSPLESMPLTSLECGTTKVSDLTPLTGMKLTHLACDNTQVSNLRPLRGMLLTTLWCGGTGISDLTPLAGMRLTELDCAHTRVRDLSPIRGMPLSTLRCWSSLVSDLSLLEGMPLTTLSANLKLYDGEQQRLLVSLPLKAEVLQEMEDRRRTGQEFVHSVAELPVDERFERVREGLQEGLREIGAPWQMELSPVIEKDAVRELTVEMFPPDLTPLRALTRLHKLTLAGNAWISSDLSALISLPLEELRCSEDILIANASVLRSIETLRTINGEPATDFWKRIGKSAGADRQ